VTTVADRVLNHFINERVTVNSIDFLSRTSIGHDSTSYKSTGKHMHSVHIK